MSDIKVGDIVNWRTKNGRGNPCSRRAAVYFAPQGETVMLYVYGAKKLKRVPLSEVRAIRTAQPKVEAVSDAEYDVICGDECVASASGPKEDAWLEAMQYAQQYQADGEIEIWEVTRRKVWPNGQAQAADEAKPRNRTEL
jgi:hypothetical protein